MLIYNVLTYNPQSLKTQKVVLSIPFLNTYSNCLYFIRQAFELRFVLTVLLRFMEISSHILYSLFFTIGSTPFEELPVDSLLQEALPANNPTLF